MPTAISRRNLFRLRPRDVITLLHEAKNTGKNEDVHPAYIRPPGAREESAFLEMCTRCGKCAEACPHGVIQELGAVAGMAEGTPFLSPETHPCRWCSHLDCIRACPEGALSFEPDAAPRPIAKATLHIETCLNREGILCDTCVMICPPLVKAISLQNREPQVDSEKCVGCGLCAWHCESRPSSFTIQAVSTASSE